jgi:hypothetical protein
MFWSIVGHASFHTAGPMGPSTIDRSNFLCLVPTCATNPAVYYAAWGRSVSIPAKYENIAGTGDPVIVRRLSGVEGGVSDG